jgi:predicted DNA-binding transcriptional regulator YafY
VTGADPAIGEDRTFRLDRIASARTLPGSFEPPDGFDAAERVLTGLATTPYRYEVTLRVQGTAEQIRTRLPAGIATVAESPSVSGAESDPMHWSRVELRAERLDWLPAVLASLDLPFVIERPDELRDLVVALAGRLTHSARRSSPA